jgi:hypothetical protein
MVLGCGSSPAAEVRVPELREVAGDGGYRERPGVVADQRWAAMEEGRAARHRGGGCGAGCGLLE